MSRLETFKPRLREVSIAPNLDQVVVTAKHRTDQAVLPIELLDFLLRCRGDRTVAEIVESIFKDKGTIQFKSVIKALGILRERNLLVNGHDLELPDDHKVSDQHLWPLLPELRFALRVRLFAKHERPVLFYILATATILTAIFALGQIPDEWSNLRFSRISESYLLGLPYLFVTLSFVLALKAVLRATLQIFLTGRSHNFALAISPLFLTFRSADDSLFLVRHRFYLALFYLASYVSPLSIVYACSYFGILPPALKSSTLSMVTLLLFLKASPFQPGDLGQFLKAAFPDDSLRRLSSAFKSLSLLSVLRMTSASVDQILNRSLVFYGAIWTVAFGKVLLTGLRDQWMVFSQTTQGVKGLEFALGAAWTALLCYWLVAAVVAQTWATWFDLKVHVSDHIKRLRLRGLRQRLVNFDRNRLVELLEELPLFNYFPTELLQMLLTKAHSLQFKKDELIFSQGDVGREIFVLLDGELEVRRHLTRDSYEKLGEIHAPSVFGEVAVLQDCLRTASVVATTAVQVLSIPSKSLRLAANDNHYIRELQSFKTAILVNQFFASAPVFKELPETVIQLFTARGKVEHFLPGNVVFSQGDPGDSFYLVLRGTVGVTVNGQPVGKIGQSGFFGEISLIADTPRTGSVLALTDVVTLKVGRESFWEILAHDLRLAVFIENVGENRIKEDIEVLKGKNAKIA
jgi:CRP-like cAMP-binding protein